MGNFELSVKEQAFARLGVRAIFNECLYGELLDEFSMGSLTPVIRLRPDPLWGLTRFQRIMARLQHPTEQQVYGGYSDSRLEVVCSDDLAETNDSLLHETKHFIDDETGDALLDDAIAMKRMIAMASSLALANVTSTYLCRNNPSRILASNALTLSGAVALCRYRSKSAPDELKARVFACDPDIVEAYGHIIAYEAA